MSLVHHIRVVLNLDERSGEMPADITVTAAPTTAQACMAGSGLVVILLIVLLLFSGWRGPW